MVPRGLELTPLERAVLRAICESHVADRAVLEVQLSSASVLSRENTGAGFYTRLSIEHPSGTAVGGERLRRGPFARIEGLERGMGFILWLHDGVADCLEGFSFDESTTRIALYHATFEIVPAPS